MFCLGIGNLGLAPNEADVPFRLDIAGANRFSPATSKLLAEGFSVNDAIGERNVCKFSLHDSSGALHQLVGQPVYALYHGARIFAGTIDDLGETVANKAGDLYTEVNSVDFNQLCDRFFVANSYENMTLKAIVQDIVMIQTRLGAEGITLDEVEEGPIITKATFGYRTVTECFNDLADASGLVWNVDYHKRLRFFSQENNPAPFRVDDTNPIYFRDFRYRQARTKYRNRQILRAGIDLTDVRIESFRGDSTNVTPEKRRRAFNVSYPVGKTPIVRKNGALQRVGVRGKDKDGDLTIPNFAQWFYQVEENEFAQNSREDETLNPTLGPDDILLVEYQGQFPIVMDIQDDQEMQARASIEGGTGEYGWVDEDAKVDGRDLAAEKAGRLLDIYGHVPDEISYRTSKWGLFAGQLQPVTRAQHSLADISFLLERVETRLIFARVISVECSVSAMEGERQEIWLDFFRKLAKAGKTTVIREKEVVTLTRKFPEQINFTDVLTDSVNGSATLNPYYDDVWNFMRVGNYAVPSGDTVYAMRVGRMRIGRPYPYA